MVSDKQDLLVNEQLVDDKFFDIYIEARILFLDLNARAINARVLDYIKESNNLDVTIKAAAGSIQHMRMLIYSSELSIAQSNLVARSYVLELINTTTMVLYKLYSNDKGNLFNESKTLKELIYSIDTNAIEKIYNSVAHTFPFEVLMDKINNNSDDWRLMDENGVMDETEDNFITDFTSLFFSLLTEALPGIDEKEDLLKEFVLEY